MVKKSLIISLTIIILSLCCGISFAVENNSNSTDLGNEITQSMNKTGDSIGNVSNAVFSVNMVENAKNTITDGVSSITNMMTNGMDSVNNTINKDMRNEENGMRKEEQYNVTRENYGNYNTTRTTTEGNIANNNMSTTTWMWIILVVASIVIIAAIWFYATQDNND